ncbi:uncharacterized protein LAJ45_10258 [Morchella importuna]|nr:uncharacterized protein LAJ45_10258 [Morchella importuna]KAH8145781.1 hypothetical protein LAJ45_10258 [Morchella importuna]
MGGKGSLRALKEKNQQDNAPTTTNAQLLRMKRSMPNIGGRATPGSPKNNTVRSPSRNSGGRPASRNSVGRPPSSTGGRPPSSTGGRSTATGRNDVGRSKTPGERKPAPFLPAGSTVRQSHHISAKISQQTLEYKEKIAAERRTNSRHQQRTPHHSPSSSIASSKTKRGTPTIAPEPLRRQAAAIETLRQPTRKRNFGDGTELETFDDLPTSAKAENRFVVTPVGRGAPKATKSQSVPITRASGKDAGKDGESPAKRIDLSRDLSSRFAEVPRFARDTSASRNAREQRMGITNTGAGHTGTNQWKQQVAARGNASPKNRRKPQLKPQLIKPMGSISNPPKAAAAVNGMTYNSKTFKWEGNENEVKGFETEKIPTPPRPALISNVNHSGSKLGIQVVGGMVFDPASMSWLKVDEDPDEENDDPFEGFDDLMDHDMTSNGFSGDGGDSAIGPIFGGGSAGGGSRSGTRLSGGYGEFVVGEEFDVGPEFVRRQREEEDRWRKRVDGWISTGEATKMENKWAIRDLLER